MFATTPATPSAKAVALDHLFAQAAICTQIDALAPELRASGVDELATALEANIAAPRVFVVYEGETVADDAARATRVSVRQKWTILLVVRHSQQVDKGGRNAVAGPILARLNSALCGHVPDGAQRPLRRTSGPAARYTPAVGIYPLTFELQLEL